MDFLENIELASKTTLRVGGPARWYFEPTNEAELAEALKKAKEQGIRYFILGRGSNLIVPPEGFEGLVLRLQGPYWKRMDVDLAAGKIWASAGARLKELCGLLAREGVAGFEFAEGIPASVGGALRMNAGAMKGAMSEIVKSVRCMHPDGRIEELPIGALGYGYRKCKVLEGAIALGAYFKVPEELAGQECVREQMEAFATKRKASQPRQPSAGCVFKNPEGDYASRLIDSAGLKGVSIGAAQVSDVHANFIVNTGDATAAEVLELVRKVHDRVYEVHGVCLQPEAQLMGQTWDKYLELNRKEKVRN